MTLTALAWLAMAAYALHIMEEFASDGGHNTYHAT
jgi:hypothetical protein